MSDAVVERIRALSKTHTDSRIADMLNQADIQTAQGKPFTARRVQGLRRRYQIGKRPPASDQ